MSSSNSTGTEGEDTPDLARLASDWIALWQGELAAMGADPELTAAWGAWPANLAAWARNWAGPSWPVSGWPASPWPPTAAPGAGWAAAPSPGWPPAAPFNWPPMPWPPATAPHPVAPSPEPPHDPAARPAPSIGASVPGPEPGLAGNGLDPLLQRLDAVERELAGLRAELAAGQSGTRKDPAKPRRR
ncbi:hypothetical protein [Roseomonas harenae]|uniref:hypothetical protein n=1 Tax=Muricoccus harenae TaxID=2692566 RepID=UPI001F204E3A|nr:hypothetical protein [Roseomonas harenae]